MSPTSILRLTARNPFRTPIPRPTRSIQTTRLFSQTPLSRYPRKDSQDKDSINTEATEYSKSGTDDGAAKQEEAAFDPKTTNPEKEHEIAGEGEAGNPLEVSPANPDVSQQGGKEAEGGAENSAGNNKSSGAGSPSKAGKP